MWTLKSSLQRCQVGPRQECSPYVDFEELPPALPGGSTAGVQSSEQLLIVQTADYRRTRRRVPDGSGVLFSLLHGGYGGAGKTDGPIRLYGRNHEGSPEVCLASIRGV